MDSSAAPVLVTGANGFVGARICTALIDRGVGVRALVRRLGSAPAHPGLEEVLGDFTDPDGAAKAVDGVSAVVSTVHPMGSDRATQHHVGVEGTATLARAAASAGVGRLIHISTAGVYDRSPGVGDVDESSALVPDDGYDYGVTKRDTDLALAEISGITRVLLRPPAILGSGPTSTWNTLRPREMREDPHEYRAVPEQSWPWVHVSDLASLAADLAGDGKPDGSASGPAPGDCTALNVVAATDTLRDYYSAVASAIGVDPVWDSGPAWTGRLAADRALGWGWTPTITLSQALAELATGLSFDAGSARG